MKQNIYIHMYATFEFWFEQIKIFWRQIEKLINFVKHDNENTVK